LQYYFNPTSSIKLLGGAYDFQSAYKGVMDAITGKVVIPTDNETLAALFTSEECKNARHNLVDYLRYGFGGIMDAQVLYQNK
jgi:hypothetical protein